MNEHTEQYKKIVKKVLIGTGFAFVLIIGILVGRLSNAQPDLYAHGLLGNSTASKDLAQFWGVWKLLNEKYPFKENIPTDTERIHGAIAGMVASFKDPYTSFFPPREAKMFEEDVRGEFGGIGAEVGIRNNFITIVSPLKDSPAEKSGIEPGDVIVKINEESTEKMSVDQAVSLIRGSVGTSVVLTIARTGEKDFITKTIIRDLINLPVIKTEQKNGAFIINFYTFTENSAELFEQALGEFKQSRSNKLIIDMRNNPGGYLNAAIDIGSFFIPQGKIILRENQGAGKPELVYRSHGTDIQLPKNTKIIVLVNQGSASASEILAGALAEHGIAKIVGTQTFGKGSVQELIPLSDGSSVKITVAQWLTPNGISISEKGVTPEFIVTTDPTDDSDPILEKALQLLR
jgi:carboxyl-terminal processing protease